MKKSVSAAGAISIVIAVVLAWYWASPFFAVAGLRNAAVRGDTRKLNEVIDFPRLREEIKTQFSSILIGKMSENLRGNPFAAFGIVLATKLTDVMVDAMVTPAGIAALVDPRNDRMSDEVSGFNLLFSRDFDVHRQGLSSFEYYRANEREKNPTLRFNRDGLQWRLVSLQLPKEFLAEKIGDRVGSTQQTEKYVPKWEFHERKDPMDDTLSVFLSRSADEEVSTRFTSVRPTLVFRCRGNKFDAYINVKSSVDFDYQSYRTSVRLRFDDGPPRSENWAVSKDREALFIPNPESFLKSLLETAALQFEWRQLGSGPGVARFTRDDLESHAVQFADRCGKPRLVRKSSNK